MAESNELFSEIATLKDQVDDIRRSVSAIARSTDVTGKVLKAMESDPLMAEVFLLVDGFRTQKEIVAKLKVDKKGGSQATVSRKIDFLIEDWDLVRPASRSGNGITYVQTSLAKDLKIARALSKSKPKK